MSVIDSMESDHLPISCTVSSSNEKTSFLRPEFAKSTLKTDIHKNRSVSSPELLALIADKRRVRRLYQRSRDLNLWKTLQDLTHQVHKLLRQLRQDAWTDKLSEINNTDNHLASYSKNQKINS